MAITPERLEALLYNALVLLEEEYSEQIIGSDLEEKIGITAEEYDEIMPERYNDIVGK